MNYGKIIYFDTANAVGLSTVLFVSGCNHQCEDCFNPETWNPNYGKPYNRIVENRIINSLKSPIKNLVISGGDPLYKNNREVVLSLCMRVQHETEAKVILYTGYLMEEIEQMKEFNMISNYVNIIIDGKFDKNNPSPILDFRGSLNQRAWELSLIRQPKNISNSYFKYKTKFDF